MAFELEEAPGVSTEDLSAAESVDAAVTVVELASSGQCSVATAVINELYESGSTARAF